MKLKTAQFCTIMLFALVVGVFWGTWFSLSRSISTIAPGTFLEIGKTMINNLAGPMRLLMPGAILAAVITLWLFPDRRSAPFCLTFSGLSLMIVALIITLSVNVPIDNQIKEWTMDSMPLDWNQIRDRWETFHAIRTFVSIGGLALVLIGALKTTKALTV